MEHNQNDQASEPHRIDLSADLSAPGTAKIEMALPKLVLASASPRRAEILRMSGWDFETFPTAVDETRRIGEDAAPYVERVAREKAEAAAQGVADRIVVGADTVVVIDGEILGKPRDAEDARRMLRLLQDRWHKVVTGICVINKNSAAAEIAHETTEVKFGPMTEDEIDWYVSTGEPMDKAGAYAIQGLSARFIERIRGDYLNVVGLPLRELYKIVEKRNG